MLTITAAGRSDRGRIRQDNQDRWGIEPTQGLYLVADGMGGRLAGGLAAQQVVDQLPVLLTRYLGGGTDLDAPEATEQVLAALRDLSAQLWQESAGRPGLEGMGATVVLALVRKAHALIAWLGDSRAYLLRARRLEQVTQDHTIVQILLSTGEITPEEAATHPARGQVTRFVGMAGEALPEARVVPLLPGDRLFLCTDGVTRMLSERELLAILQCSQEPDVVCRQVIEAANAAGGTDNMTALLVDCGEGETERRAERTREKRVCRNKTT